ncbi:protein LYK5-like [Neltuma alba]|uniref:protein LYK5-like n=1 Tax=Neltuma alba TaxID=207710 RepID=UPI0010A56B36|nr:protein LYK5-like [Prosopis alba]
MCKTKMAVDASSPRKPRTSKSGIPSSSRPTLPAPAASSSYEPSTSYPSTAPYSASSGFKLTSDTSISSGTSLASFRGSLPENPHIYDFSEIRSATNNFLAKRYSSSSSTPSWRCVLRGRDVIVFQRKFRRKLQTNQLRDRLSVICRSHHVSIIKLVGACISGEHIYLVYDFVNGANLSDCLRNTKNVNFTVLSSWISRMQVATDLAEGLDYIHNKTGLTLSLVHNHIKSSAIIVTELSFNARISHFGASQLCGEIDEESENAKEMEEITEEPSTSPSSTKSKDLRRSRSSNKKFEGVKGYMAPEYKSTGVATQKSDVYAFGVVILELLSGDEPLKFKYDKKTGEFVSNSVIDKARAVLDGDPAGGGGVEGRLRRWIDRRLRDSFPVEVAEEVTRVALECVHVDPDKRPNMGRVAGKISRLYLKSKIWSDNVKTPTDILSASFAPR